MKRFVYFLSDSTGITAESLGHCLLTQFNSIEFEQITIPYINNESEAEKIIHTINQQYKDSQIRPLVFATFSHKGIRDRLSTCEGVVIDFFSAFITLIERELGCSSSGVMGSLHSLQNYKDYTARIEAVNYALAHDDGVSTKNYGEADVIILGVSRSGKTPSSLYLALQFGIRAANYPLTSEDLDALQLPDGLAQYKKKLFGLLIDPLRLAQIREERFASSRYASLAQCQHEIKRAQQLFREVDIPYIDSTNRSIEEISTKILAIVGIKRRLQ